MILAHLTADFYFQTDKMAAHKSQYLTIHVFIHFAVTCCLLLALLFWSGTVQTLWLQVATASVLLASGHYGIDRLKLFLTRCISGRSLHQVYLFAADQILHFIFIFITAFLFFGIDLPSCLRYVQHVLSGQVQVPFSARLLFGVILFILTTTVTGHFIRILVGVIPDRLSLFEGKYVLRNGGEANPVNSAPQTPDFDEAFTYMIYPASDRSRGRMIGYIERLLIVIFVVSGSFAGIGFIVAAKSVARFKQMDDRQFAEYFLLGTLTSVLFGIVSGLTAKIVLFS